MKNHIERPVSAILFFNTLANTGSATFAGELTPKILGVHHAERLAPRIIGLLTWLVRLCYPVILLIEKFGQRLKSSASGEKTKSHQIMDIITLVQSARAEQLLHKHEEIIMTHAATLGARRIKTAMISREDVRVFDKRKRLLEPITGYMRVRELFVRNLNDPASADWKRPIRPVLHIDEKALLPKLLTSSSRNKRSPPSWTTKVASSPAGSPWTM